MKNKDYLKMANDLMRKNGIGDYFSENIPPEWPLEVWEYLLKVKNEKWDEESLHYWISHHTYIPDAIVRQLSRSPYWRVRSRIAEKRNLPADLFLILSKDNDEAVRSSIAKNKKAPLDIIKGMENDQAETVQRMVKIRLARPQSD